MNVADAWTNLKENSSLPSGDAWEHLLAQEGSEGTIIVDREIYVYMEPLEVDLETGGLEVDLTIEELDIELLDNAIEVSLEEEDGS